MVYKASWYPMCPNWLVSFSWLRLDIRCLAIIMLSILAVIPLRHNSPPVVQVLVVIFPLNNGVVSLFTCHEG